MRYDEATPTHETIDPELIRQEPAMTSSLTPLIQLPAWQALEAHHAKVHPLNLRKLFAD